jgi:hypothetical protein
LPLHLFLCRYDQGFNGAPAPAAEGDASVRLVLAVFADLVRFLFLLSAKRAPLAEVSPAPLEMPAPVPPGAIVSAFAAPAEVEELAAPCDRASGDANAAISMAVAAAMCLNPISFSLV